MLYLWIYLGLGVLAAAIVADRRLIFEAIGHFLGVLLAVTLWPYGLGGKLYADHKRKAENKRSAVYRAHAASMNCLKYDVDGWWAGADLADDYVMKWRPRRAV